MSTMQPRDRLIPWYFVAFFVVLIIVDGTMATIAVRTQTGVVTKHPYEQGLAYNKIVDASQKQEILGWKGDIEFHSEVKNTGKLNFILKDKSGTVIKPDNVSAKITRPTQDGVDFEVKLNQTKSDTFTADINFPLAGLWEIRIFAKNGKDSFQQSKRVVVE